MLMGVTQYAEHRGCRLYAVQFAIAAGRISLNEQNLIDSEAADRDWDGNTEQTRSHPQPKLVDPPVTPPGSPSEPPRKRATEAEPGISFTEARALREVYDAQRKLLELQVRRGDLVLAADVEREAFRFHRQIRDTCFNLPARVAAQLAAETDEATVRDILERELASIFNRFEQQLVELGENAA